MVKVGFEALSIVVMLADLDGDGKSDGRMRIAKGRGRDHGEDHSVGDKGDVEGYGNDVRKAMVQGGGGSKRFRGVWFDLYMAVFGQPTSVLVKGLPFANRNSVEAQTSEHC
ncbi:hypothetical protein Tco_0012618 [Tanacetum coccineum]